MQEAGKQREARPELGCSGAFRDAPERGEMLRSALGQEETELSKEANAAVTVMLALLHLQHLLITQGLCGEQLVRSLPLSCFCMSWPGCVLSMSDPGGSCPCVSRHHSHYGSSYVTSQF